MISSRMNSPAPGGSKMRLVGRSVNLDEDSALDPGKDGEGFGVASLAHGGLTRWRGADRLALGDGDSPGTYREMTMSELLSGGSFHLASAGGARDEAAGQWSIWARGARSNFEGGRRRRVARRRGHVGPAGRGL